jgi:hypothetical protein
MTFCDRFCLNFSNDFYFFRVDNLKNGNNRVSTPEKANETIVKLQEVSMCSTILHPNDETSSSMSKVNETIGNNMTKTSVMAGKTTSEDVLMDLNRVKKAGHFLEECRLFLSGFSESEQEKLRRVIQSAGGVRLNQLTPSVTHMVIKDTNSEHVKLLNELKLTPYKVRSDVLNLFLWEMPNNEKRLSWDLQFSLCFTMPKFNVYKVGINIFWVLLDATWRKTFEANILFCQSLYYRLAQNF